MNQLQIFENPQFGEIRTITIDNEPWFVGKDVADNLGYSNPRKAIIDHVDDDDKTDGVTIRDSIGREQNPVCINESGLYSLILGSKLPTAKQFKRWVTSEVLPSIRKNGSYSAKQLDELRKLRIIQADWQNLADDWEQVTAEACRKYDEARKHYDNCRQYRNRCRTMAASLRQQMDEIVDLLTT